MKWLIPLLLAVVLVVVSAFQRIAGLEKATRPAVRLIAALQR